ncbi:MAG: phage major capsid protein, P2 family [Novosphingobium sp.]|nr:phage major capsid protein, P2 family [Novosphingobium sp.]
MRNETRILFNQFCERIAELNEVGDATEKFTVTPSVQQKLIDKKQESSEFLSRINIVPVTEKEGAVLGLSVGGPLISNTDTSGAGTRSTTSPSSMDEVLYNCRQNNSDTHITYALLDAWAKFPDFQQRIQNQIVKRQALDNIMVGFNGTSYAVTSNKVANPLGEDVNIGWLQKLRTDKPEQVLDEGAVAGKVTYGVGADYATLDALVYDAVSNLMPTWAAEDTELVVLVSRDLLHDKYFPLINQDQAPTEQLARDVIMSTKRLGGLQADRVPYFPAGSIFVTRYDNLSIYEQDGKRRRHIKDVPERDRIEDYQSSNDSYVIEDYDFACLVENIEYKAA